MTDSKYPWWVRLGIWGSYTRATITMLLWVTLLLGLVILVFEIVASPNGESTVESKSIFWGIIFLIGGIHYYLCRRWIDRHGDWTDIRPQWIEGWKLVVFLFALFIIIGVIKAGLE
jgi:hypothetical protein